MAMNCLQHPIPPRVVAVARDTYLKPRIPIHDPINLSGVAPPMYGQDAESGKGRSAPAKQSVGTTPDELKPKMRELLPIFASKDKSLMAKRLFDAFLADTCRPVLYFDDASLNAAAGSHPNIKAFCGAALSAPNSTHKSPGKVRIHQALAQANWDIKKLVAPSDLGVPAFNLGDKALATEDFSNGLGVMINGVQHVYVIATHYHHDAKAGKYCIKLRFVFYDVFGLDDDDLAEFGASSDGYLTPRAKVGITAWWQLQHQHAYVPLITRITLEQQYEADAR